MLFKFDPGDGRTVVAILFPKRRDVVTVCGKRARPDMAVGATMLWAHVLRVPAMPVLAIAPRAMHEDTRPNDTPSEYGRFGVGFFIAQAKAWPRRFERGAETGQNL